MEVFFQSWRDCLLREAKVSLRALLSAIGRYSGLNSSCIRIENSGDRKMNFEDSEANGIGDEEGDEDDDTEEDDDDESEL